MKVLIISDAWHPQVNGVVRTYEYLCLELEAMGHDTEVIGPADFPAYLPMPFYPEIKLVLKPYTRLKRMIEDYAPDKIHIATEGPLGWAARRYCLRHKREFTTSYHTQFPDYVAKRFAWLIPPLYRIVHNFCIWWVRHFHKPSTGIFVVSSSLAQQLKDWKFKTPMHYLTRGVDESLFYPCAKTILQDMPKPIALYVGRMSIEKNLDAFLNMEWQGSKIMVGDGPIRAQLAKKYPHIRFVGKKTGKHLADYYRSCDVFVFPSKTDTFGIVLIEALACGLPIAAYPVIGPKDIVVEDYLGALDQDDLAKAAWRAIEQGDPEKCAHHIQEHYSWETAGKQFISSL